MKVSNAEQPKSTFMNKVKSYFVGECIYSGCFYSGAGASYLIMKKVSGMDEFAPLNDVKKAADNVLKENNLQDKVKLFFMNSENKEKILRDFNIIQNPKTPTILDPIAQVEKGQQAIFFPHANVILTSEKKASYVFHEIGHVINRNNVFWKGLQNSRGLLKVIPACLIFTGFAKDKEDGQKGFFKKNAGLLAGAASGLVCLEEAVASKKGIAEAKKFLPNADIKKLTKSYALMGSTYALVALGVGFGLQTAVNYIDKKVHKKA